MVRLLSGAGRALTAAALVLVALAAVLPAGFALASCASFSNWPALPCGPLATRWAGACRQGSSYG